MANINTDPIIVMCPFCNKKLRVPNLHLDVNCPACKNQFRRNFKNRTTCAVFKPGFVYIMSNRLMPGIVKIGRTNDLSRRIKELHTTGVPTPFVLEYAIRVRHPDRTEHLLHKIFKKKRISDNREFFEVTVSDVIAKIQFEVQEFDLIPVEGYN